MFNYCPVCGAALSEAHLATEDRPRLVCTACGHVFYLNPKIVSGTLPIEGSKVWLLRRGIEPRYGFWTYPAGYQEMDESTEDAARRETWEELGLHVEISRLFGVYSRAGSHVVNVVYVASLAEGASAPMLTTEAIEVGLFAPDEIPWDELAFPSTEAVLKDWVAESTLHSPGEV
jgi:ADP-ribose pyrophosphatase YjhB (NUDIX family)